jgi:SAM-dependent methyltransferase
VIFDSLPRLRAILERLPLDGVPPHALNIGCGDFPSLRTLRDALPGWMIVGMDRDGPALRRARQSLRADCAAPLHLIQADARDLPGLFNRDHAPAPFGLIMLRHPDVFRHRAMREQAIPALPTLLAPGGVLLITLYSLEETEIIRALHLPRPVRLDDGSLPRVDLAGRDRFARAYRVSDGAPAPTPSPGKPSA